MQLTFCIAITLLMLWVIYDINQTKRKINKLMSSITDWAAQEQADLTAIANTLNTISTGVAELNAQIAALQASNGLSTEDQAALDQIKAASDALVTQAQAIQVTPTPPPAATGQQ